MKWPDYNLHGYKIDEINQLLHSYRTNETHQIFIQQNNLSSILNDIDKILQSVPQHRIRRSSTLTSRS